MRKDCITNLFTNCKFTGAEAIYRFCQTLSFEHIVKCLQFIFEERSDFDKRCPKFKSDVTLGFFLYLKLI